ncbi:MAG TPA: type II CAAX endopeptidase family protein [Candidatus Saccharimonadales bacterium]
MKTAPAKPAPEKPPASAQAAVPRVPWHPWWGVLFVLLTFYISQLFGGLLISVYPWLKGWSSARATDWLNNAVTAQFAFVLLAESLAIGAVYLFLKRRNLSLKIIGLRRPHWLDLGYGMAAVPPYYVLYFLTVGVVSSLVHSLNVNQQQQIGFNNVQGGGQLLMTFISLVVLPPLAEEILVRGFLYSSLKKAMPTIWAVLLTSGLFAAAHLPEGGAAGPLYIAALDTFVLSLVLIYLREKTGSLWASITLHAFKNGIAFTALFALHAR